MIPTSCDFLMTFDKNGKELNANVPLFLINGFDRLVLVQRAVVDLHPWSLSQRKERGKSRFHSISPTREEKHESLFWKSRKPTDFSPPPQHTKIPMDYTTTIQMTENRGIGKMRGKGEEMNKGMKEERVGEGASTWTESLRIERERRVTQVHAHRTSTLDWVVVGSGFRGWGKKERTNVYVYGR